MRGILILLLALLAAACGDERDEAEATGTVEVIEVDASPLQPARVMRVWVDEGDTVRAGDTLATLTLPATKGDVDVREARLAQARAALAELEAGARPQEVASAEAELRAAAAEAGRTSRDVERYRALLEGGAVSRQQFDQVQTAARVADGRRDAAAEAVRLLRAGARVERIAAAEAEVESARAALTASRGTEDELTLVAPVAGMVTERYAEPGEMVAAGQPVVSVGEVARPWTRVYVNQRVLPGIRVGQRVEARLDAYPDRPFRGRVVSVNPRAEYTPRVALTEEERADLLFGVRVELEDRDGMLKAGLPVTVAFPARTIARAP